MKWHLRRCQQSRLLQWHHNGRDGISNHQPPDCLLNRLFGRRSKKISKLRVTGLCAGNSPWPLNFPLLGDLSRCMSEHLWYVVFAWVWNTAAAIYLNPNLWHTAFCSNLVSVTIRNNDKSHIPFAKACLHELERRAVCNQFEYANITSQESRAEHRCNIALELKDRV